MSELRMGNVSTDQNLFALFNATELDVKAQLLADEDETTPADEQYKESNIISATVIPGYVNITVTLASQSSTAEFIVPIPLVV